MVETKEICVKKDLHVPLHTFQDATSQHLKVLRDICENKVKHHVIEQMPDNFEEDMQQIQKAPLAIENLLKFVTCARCGRMIMLTDAGFLKEGKVIKKPTHQSVMIRVLSD